MARSSEGRVIRNPRTHITFRTRNWRSRHLDWKR